MKFYEVEMVQVGDEIKITQPKYGWDEDQEIYITMEQAKIVAQEMLKLVEAEEARNGKVS